MPLETYKVKSDNIDWDFVGSLKERLFSKEAAHREPNFSANAKITKIDDEKHLVFGWASIIEENGVPVVDLQGDVIDEPTLEEMAHKFITESRKAKANHFGKKVGEIVESCVFSKQLQQALGIDLMKVGWFIVVKVYDPDVWQMVKSGELQAFSIGGYAEKIPVDE